MSTIKTNQIQTITGNPILNSSGSIIQTVYVRSDAFTTFSAAASGNGTTVSALSASITPTSATNRIICNWVICGEVGSASDCVWLIHMQVYFQMVHSKIEKHDFSVCVLLLIFLLIQQDSNSPPKHYYLQILQV